jgi:hypothetical protein
MVALLVGMDAAGGGCSSGSTVSAGAAGCMTACSRCGGGLCADCAATSARFRDEFEGIVYTCVKEGGDAACITIWTDCIIKGQTQVTPRTSDTTYRDACLTKKSECDAMGVTFADDRCLLSIIFEESQVAQAMQCLSQPCANIEACFSPIFN